MMEKLHYLVMDKTTKDPLAVIIVPLDKYDFVYRFDAESYALRGLTPAECCTYIDLGNLKEADVTEFYTGD